jgi:hypothetical protein
LFTYHEYLDILKKDTETVYWESFRQNWVRSLIIEEFYPCLAKIRYSIRIPDFYFLFSSWTRLR